MVRISDRISYSIRYNYVIDHVEVKIRGNFVIFFQAKSVIIDLAMSFPHWIGYPIAGLTGFFRNKFAYSCITC